MSTETRVGYATEKDPATLEREINQTRAEMSQTLDSLERKLTAGQLLDQTLRFFGLKGTEIGSSVGRCVKGNPMPFFLTATGIGWMMLGTSQSGSARHGHRRSADYESYDYEHYRENERGITDRAGETISAAAETAKDTANRAASSAKESVGRATDTLRGGMDRTAEMAQNQAKRARDTFNSLLDEQPLVLGAVGLAIGAIIAAALPTTEQEDRLVGELSDKTLNKGKEIGARAYEKGSQIAKENIEKVSPGMSQQDSVRHNGAEKLER